MSWCRYGSKCQNTIVLFECDLVCPRVTCPGSDLYIYESDDAFVCQWCPLATGTEVEIIDFRCATEDEMFGHIEEHVKAGHHVRPSIRRDADLTEVRP